MIDMERWAVLQAAVSGIEDDRFVAIRAADLRWLLDEVASVGTWAPVVVREPPDTVEVIA